MSLRFVYGRAGSGKTRYCLNELKTKLANEGNTPLVLLVPEQFTFQAERDLIAMLETGGILKTEVLSFRRMAFRIFNEVGGITYPHIHPAGKNMILYRIMDKMGRSLKYFVKSADQPGFVGMLSALITEFKHYNITPEILAGTVEKIPEQNPFREKLAELQQIYLMFERILAERYRDADDDLTLAAEKLKQSAQYSGAEIWIDGFTDFTPQEYRIIDELLQKAKRVTITLTSDILEGKVNELNLFKSAKTAYRKLLKLATGRNISCDPTVFMDPEPLPRYRKSRELSHLERNYDAHPCNAYMEPTENISLFSAVNIFTEIEAAAEDILRLCRDRGMRFRDIGLVTRNLAGYEKLIEVVFNEYGIPFFMDKKLDVANHPLVRLILSMLDIFTENWSYEAVFRYLKSGLTGIGRDRIDRLENYVLACGIRGSRWTDETGWNMSTELLPDQRSFLENSAMLEDVNQIRLEIIAPLMEFRNRTKGRKTAAEFCTALYDFLCTLGIPERLEQKVQEFRDAGNLLLANEYSQVWNIVIALMDQMVEVMADEAFGVERFANMLEIGFAEYKVGLIPASLDQVLVGSAERSKSHEIKALFILGTNDGIFPAGGAEEGILSDEERDRLLTLGVEIAKDTRARAMDENFLIYRTLTTPSEYLRISWPIADQEGKTLRPSIIISRMRKIFPKIRETSNILPPSSNADVLELLTSREAAFRRLIGVIRQRADGINILPVWQDVARWFLRQNEWESEIFRAKKAFQYRNLVQPVSKEKIPKLYGEPVVSSVSRIEQYTACPFSFFVQYGLGARERKVFQLSPPDVGTFLHAAIERFSKMIINASEAPDGSGETVTWRSFDRRWCEQKVALIIDDMLAGMKGSGISSSKRYTALTVRLKRVVTRAVWLIAEHIRRSGFNPVDYEAGFGEGEKYPPITLELDSGEQIRLHGRIDRIDALKTSDGQYLRIIDYKSGSRDFKLSDVYYGLQLQLITYLDAIWESCEKSGGPPVLPGGMLYFRIDDPIIKAESQLTEEEIEKEIMKQLKMKGLLLADVKLVKEMDRTIEGASLIVPATLNKGDVLGKKSSVATMEQFKLLRRYVRQLLKDLSREILQGSITIKPVKNREGTACKFCVYSPVCQFDPAMRDNTYRLLYDKGNDEIWKLLTPEKENENGGAENHAQ